MKVMTTPATSELKEVFYKILQNAVNAKASNIHIRSDSRPIIRRQGELMELAKQPLLSASDVREILENVLLSGEKKTRTLQILADQGVADFSYQLEGVSRFRRSEEHT